MCGQVHGGVGPPRNLICWPFTRRLWRVLLCLLLGLPRAGGEAEQVSGDAESVGDPAHHVEGGDALAAADDRADLAWGELAGHRDSVLGEPAPLLDQGEDSGEVVLSERPPYVVSVEDFGGEGAGGGGVHGPTSGAILCTRVRLTGAPTSVLPPR